jgi:hypothetical protein
MKEAYAVVLTAPDTYLQQLLDATGVMSTAPQRAETEHASVRLLAGFLLTMDRSGTLRRSAVTPAESPAASGFTAAGSGHVWLKQKSERQRARPDCTAGCS